MATTFLFVGFAGLLLNMPLIGGLGWFEASWLPGFGSEACSWGIWFVYAGLLIGLFTTLYYVLAGYRKMQKARRLKQRASKVSAPQHSRSSRGVLRVLARKRVRVITLT